MTNPLNPENSPPIEAALRIPLVDDELIMARWDDWRAYIADGHRGSWPRDQFEMLLSRIDEEREEAADEIARLQVRIAELESVAAGD